MKKQPPKLMNLFIIIFLYVIAAAFFAYGIHVILTSAEYISSYKSSSYATDHNIIQYIADESILYFIAGFITLIGAVILTTLNRLQRNIYESVLQLNNNRITSSYNYDTYSSPDEEHDFEIQPGNAGRSKNRRKR